MKVLASLAVVICLLSVCYGGQETVEYSKVRSVPTLEGTVTDIVGATVTGVRVAVMSDDWKVELRSTFTDDKGHWSMPESNRGKTYFLQLTKDAFNTVRLRVKVTKWRSKPLVVKMPVAT